MHVYSTTVEDSTMDILAFIAKITDSLAWPAATVIGIWLVKGHLFEFISSLGFNMENGITI